MTTLHNRTAWSAWFHQVRVDCHRDTEKNHVKDCGGHSPLSNIHEYQGVAPHDVGKIDVSHVSPVSCHRVQGDDKHFSFMLHTLGKTKIVFHLCTT